MSFSSVRFQLTLWNVLVLMIVLFGCGLALVYRTQTYLLNGVDQSLEDRARPLLAPHPPPAPPPGRPPGMQPGFGGPSANGFPAGFGGPPMGFPPPDRGGPPMRLPAGIRRIPLNSPDDSGPSPFDQAAFRESAGGGTVWTTIDLDGARTRLYSAPVRGAGGGVDAVVQVEQPLAPMEEQVANLTRMLLTLIPLGMLAAGAGGAFLTARALKPVQQMADSVGRIQAEDLGQRLPVRGNDEFSHLATTLNAMLARLQAAFDEQRRFTMDASHELKTPLTVIKAKTSVALTRERPAESYRGVIEAVDRAADQMAGIVQDLLLLAQADSGQLGKDADELSLRDLIEKAREGVWVSDGPPIEVDLPDPAPPVVGNATQLARVVRNLLQNAVGHTPADGCVRVSARERAGEIEIAVSDTGEGIAPEHISHLTERFYRVDTARSRQTGGTGLGLAICKSIVEAHDGRLEIESALGAGTTVRIFLPDSPSRRETLRIR